MPNLTPIPSGTDPSQVTAMINNNFRALNNEQVTKLYNDANGTPNILIGLDSTGNSRIKVAKSGIDVTTATDGQLLFNSAQNVFKIVYEGDIALSLTTITNPGAGNYGSINANIGSYAHNLGYKPVVFAFMDFGSGVRAQLPYTVNDTSAPSNAYWLSFTANVSATNVLIGVRGLAYGVGVSTFPNSSVHFYLLQETSE